MPTHLETLLAEIFITQQLAGAPTMTMGDQEKLLSDIWKGTMDVLLQLTQQGSEQGLSFLWHSWANCKK
jgi:hypothetical protein